MFGTDAMFSICIEPKINSVDLGAIVYISFKLRSPFLWSARGQLCSGSGQGHTEGRVVTEASALLRQSYSKVWELGKAGS